MLDRLIGAEHDALVIVDPARGDACGKGAEGDQSVLLWGAMKDVRRVVGRDLSYRVGEHQSAATERQGASSVAHLPRGARPMSSVAASGLIGSEGLSNRALEQHVVIVAGHIVVNPEERESYLAGCLTIVEQGRSAPGCLDFAITADLVDPGRIDILERWASQDAVEAFRSSGPSEEQGAAMLAASVAEYDVVNERPLT